MIYFCVFASPAFESRAKVTLDSVKKFYPECKPVFVTVVSDQQPGTYIEGFAKSRLKWVKEQLEKAKEDDRYVILGADCVFYHHSPGLVDVLNKYTIVLVPHTVAPPVKDTAWAYQTGHANADFMSFGKGALGILEWLLEQQMDNSPGRGVFYEQTWISALPFIADDVLIIRDPAINYAYFNTHERELTERSGKYYVNGLPLLMAQFSGYVQGSPQRMSKYWNGSDVTGTVLKLFTEYEEAISKQ